MKKKILNLSIAAIMLSALALGASAASIDPPVYPDDYNQYNPYNDPTTANNNVIPGWGYIGFDAVITPDPDPDVPPVIDPEDATKFIDVEVPIQFIWAAFESNSGTVESPSYQIVNNNTKSNLTVSMKSFKAVGGDALPAGSTLVLNLTQDLALANILSAGAQNHTFTDTLDASSTWNFGINGTYTGQFPSQHVQPKYEMVLNFAVESVNQ